MHGGYGYLEKYAYLCINLLTNLLITKMKQKILAMFAFAVLLLGMSACSENSDNPANPNLQEMEQSLVGLWWDEYEYSDVTEAGVSFERVLLAVNVNADHTGCIYLGVFDNTDDNPLAVYGGPEDAGFSWSLLPDGSVQLIDLTTGESMARTRGDKGDNDSYGDGMTDVSSTTLNYSNGNVAVVNGSYSNGLDKADDEKKAEIEKMLSTLSPDRQNFEAQLSKMLAESQQYLNLDPTMKAVKMLTEFIDQLKISALGPQITNIILGMLNNNVLAATPSLDPNDPETAEARWALANSNVAIENATSYFLLSATNALSNSALEFTTGQDEAQYVTTNDGVFTISSKNNTTGAVTKVKMKFSAADDGVSIFLAKLANVPIAVQFPHMIDMELLRSETGNAADEELVMKGQVMLESTDGKKYISLKRGEWRATFFTEAMKDDRFELPACELIHHADHSVEVTANLAINGKNVMGIKAKNPANPYTSEELEQLRELRDIAPLWKGCYTLLKAFNSRTDKIELTLAEDLLFDIDILDAGKCLKAAANVLKYRKQQPSKEVIDPWTDMLNEAATFTVTQKSTGVKADGKFITDVIDGDNMPSVAVRFKGESDFHVIHDRMSPTDYQNYEALLKSFDEPFDAINALLKVIQEKGLELKEQKEANSK